MKRSLMIMLMVAALFSSTTLFAYKNPNPKQTAKPVINEQQLNFSEPASPESDGKTLITKEEFDQKMKSGGRTEMIGGILMGGGGALMIGGIVYVAAAANKKEMFGGLRGAAVGVPLALAGMGVEIGGIVTLISGVVKKHNVKKNYYYSLMPVTDPQRKFYGLNLSARF